jgi:hypothetical protein
MTLATAKRILLLSMGIDPLLCGLLERVRLNLRQYEQGLSVWADDGGPCP